jgi:protocatechuate 3,4-dioxygenase beta subunit
MVWRNIMLIANVHRLTRMTVLAFAASAAVAAQTGTLRGSISDSNGAAVSNAYVVIHADATGRETMPAASELMLRSDADGHFSTDLEHGFYDVCVMANAFTPDCRKLRIRSGRITEHRIRLKVDAAVISTVADTL